MSLEINTFFSAHRALLGEIKPFVRAISLETSKDIIKLWVYHDGEVSSDEKDYFDSVVITQIFADFPDPEKGDPICEFEFVRIDQPELLKPVGRLLYERWEIEKNQGIGTND